MAKYSKGASKKVQQVMEEMKKGKLKSSSGQKVTSRKQAIAIGLSEARDAGEKVPAQKSAGKAASKKATAKRAAMEKSAAKKGTATKAAFKKAATKKSAVRKRQS